jgi:hypothetical protein
MADNFFTDGQNPYEVVQAELVTPQRQAPRVWWRVVRSVIIALIIFVIAMNAWYFLVSAPKP